MDFRLYRLIERHQRIDDALRLARSRSAEWMEIARLTMLKRKAKQLIDRSARRPVRV